MDIDKAIALLTLHHESFFHAQPYADETKHPTPTDTRSWSQILVSLLTGIQGIAREKGADLADGSDVKAANTWGAIDTPRFNGVIKAGTKSSTSGKLESLDKMPYLFFVLWDNEPENNYERCRVWVVRTQVDQVFRDMCLKWYHQRDEGIIISNNFQLHPPRGRNSDIFRNTCGNLTYPLFFRSDWINHQYQIIHHEPDMLLGGECKEIQLRI